MKLSAVLNIPRYMYTKYTEQQVIEHGNRCTRYNCTMCSGTHTWCQDGYISLDFLVKHDNLFRKYAAIVPITTCEDFIKFRDTLKSNYITPNLQITKDIAQKMLDDGMIGADDTHFISPNHVTDYDLPFLLNNYKKLLTKLDFYMGHAHDSQRFRNHYKCGYRPDGLVDYKLIKQYPDIANYANFQFLTITDEEDLDLAAYYHRKGEIINGSNFTSYIIYQKTLYKQNIDDYINKYIDIYIGILGQNRTVCFDEYQLINSDIIIKHRDKFNVNIWLHFIKHNRLPVADVINIRDIILKSDECTDSVRSGEIVRSVRSGEIVRSVRSWLSRINVSDLSGLRLIAKHFGYLFKDDVYEGNHSNVQITRFLNEYTTWKELSKSTKGYIKNNFVELYHEHNNNLFNYTNVLDNKRDKLLVLNMIHNTRLSLHALNNVNFISLQGIKNKKAHVRFYQLLAKIFNKKIKILDNPKRIIVRNHVRKYLGYHDIILCTHH
jgi:hypothetical protein